MRGFFLLLLLLSLSFTWSCTKAIGVDTASSALTPPDLAVTVTSTFAGTAAIGDRVTFDVALTNLADSASTTSTVVVIVPAGGVYEATLSGNAWTCPPGSRGRTACMRRAPSLEPAGRSSARLVVSVVSSPGALVATARLINAADTVAANNNAALSIPASRILSTVTVANQSFAGVSIGPDRTAMYAADEPPGTPPNRARLVAPTNFDGAADVPLVVMLHGLDGSADQISQAYGGNRWAALATSRGYFLLLPNGTLGPRNHRHWNATDTCCAWNAGDTIPRDDVGYLRDLIAESWQKYRIDQTRVYVVGYSNGAFMAYRLACEIPQAIAAIHPVAGATFQDEALCRGTVPVSVLHIHGTADPNVRFLDTTPPGQSYDADGCPETPAVIDQTTIPGVAATLGRWATKARCLPGMVDRATFDLWAPHPTEPGVCGALGGPLDTTARGYNGCTPGIDVELWEIAKGTHQIWFESQPTRIADGILPPDRAYTWLSGHHR